MGAGYCFEQHCVAHCVMHTQHLHNESQLCVFLRMSAFVCVCVCVVVCLCMYVNVCVKQCSRFVMCRGLLRLASGWLACSLMPALFSLRYPVKISAHLHLCVLHVCTFPLTYLCLIMHVWS